MSRRAKPKLTLPPACRDCRPFGGSWRQALNGGMERCACARGRALEALEEMSRKPKRRKRLASFDAKMAAAGKE